MSIYRTSVDIENFELGKVIAGCHFGTGPREPNADQEEEDVKTGTPDTFKGLTCRTMCADSCGIQETIVTTRNSSFPIM